jgi:Fic family protein
MSKLSARSEQISLLQYRYRKALTNRFFLLSKILSQECAENIEQAKDLNPIETANLETLLLTAVESAEKEEPSPNLMESLHKIATDNCGDKTCGRFRKNKERARIKTAEQDYTAPKSGQITDLLCDALAKYYSSHHLGIVQRVARFHLDFCHIRPFVDANGRVALALVNHLLVREGFPPIVIHKSRPKELKKYNQSFKEFNQKKVTKKMEEIIAQSLLNSLHKRLAYLDNKTILPLSSRAHNKKSSLPNLLNKAKRGTIAAFVEDGVWKIGVKKIKSLS